MLPTLARRNQPVSSGRLPLQQAGQIFLEGMPERSGIFDTEMRRRIGVEDFSKKGWITRFAFTEGINWVEITDIGLDPTLQECSERRTALKNHTFADPTTLAGIDHEPPGKFICATWPGISSTSSRFAPD
jgi:hypothetical protein